MTWRSSSISKAHFNETWYEDTFGQYAQAFFVIFVIWPILWPTGGHLENQTFAIYSEELVGALYSTARQLSIGA
jgi:hypothetical protein